MGVPKPDKGPVSRRFLSKKHRDKFIKKLLRDDGVAVRPSFKPENAEK